jgi:opacity protein-like surface antigen
MLRRRETTVIAVMAVALFAVLALATSASAEGFADIFLGASMTTKGDVDLDLDGASVNGDDQEYKTSVLVGGRTGYWWGLFGINLDLSWFQPEFDPDEITVSGPFNATVKTDLDVVGIGLNAMLRLPLLKGSRFSGGRLQPYIFAGPTLFVSILDAEVSALGVTDSDTDTATSLGATAGTGLTFMFTPGIGAFAEYRFTYNKREFEVGDLKIEPELNTHHLLAGVTFRF